MITSAAEFCRLRESQNPEEYHRAAHDEASIAIWMEVIDQHPDMRFWVAQNKTVPIEVLEILASDSDSSVRDMVARKRKISEVIALRLAEDPDATVRAALATNRNLPPSAVAKLQHDQSELVVSALKTNRENKSCVATGDQHRQLIRSLTPPVPPLYRYPKEICLPFTKMT